MGERAQRGTARTQLARLATLTDVVYAVALVLIMSWLPLPEESHSQGAVWIAELWFEYLPNIMAAVIGLAFVILYWLRSNALMSALDRTDGAHTGFSIASVFSLLLLLYVVRVSEQVAAPSRRVGESVAVALIGLTSGAAWWYARRKDLVCQDIREEERAELQITAFAEPLAALVTLPFAHVGELAWNLSWLGYLPIAAMLRRGRARSA